MIDKEQIENLLDSPFRIIDIVPADSEGQYAAVEQYFLKPNRLRELRRTQAELILKLNCYYSISVSFDAGESWENNPNPARYVERLTALSNGRAARILIPEQKTMIDLDGCDTYMTVYNPSDTMCGILDKLAQAAGLFLWK